MTQIKFEANGKAPVDWHGFGTVLPAFPASAETVHATEPLEACLRAFCVDSLRTDAERRKKSA